jgi:predicted nucleic acid-binding protein
MPTKVACFLDTNVLLYAVLGRLDEPTKFQISRNLVAIWNFGLSTQVLGEFFVNSQRRSERRLQRPLTAAEATEFVMRLNDRPCVAVDRSVVHLAIAYAHRYQISYWDAAIVAAAEQLETAILYTEDLNHGQRYGSVRVVNPFISS